MYLRSYLNSQEVMELIDHIIHSDFVESMKQGTINDEQFRYYLRQDHIYLKYYKAAGENIGTNSNDNEIKQLYNEIGSEEPQFHKDMLNQFGIAEAEIKESEINFTTYSYINIYCDGQKIHQSTACYPCFHASGHTDILQKPLQHHRRNINSGSIFIRRRIIDQSLISILKYWEKKLFLLNRNL